MSKIKLLSWGCGTPSTTLGVMSALGDLDRLDAIIHADTGWESNGTIAARDWYKSWFENRGIPVHIVSAGNIKIDGAREHIHIPFWTSDGGPLRRQCTNNFKITPNKRKSREIAGCHARNAPHPPPGTIEQWLGYTLDEWTRMKDSRVRFIVHRYPFIQRKMSRADCVDYLDAHNLPVPPKSACVCCPYRSASEWLEMRNHSPDEFEAACQFDEENRHNPLAVRGGSTSDELYLYKHAVPLRGADLESDAERERRDSAFQIPMLCGAASCWS